ncbi:hypothetical protein [Microcoleus sp. D2_18a_D3]|uniref:hypothetical protein n=1 Tax=Microcoleus sp. D2_18a_D3 TaxID=3055330 RepID=UPI002FD09AB3
MGKRSRSQPGASHFCSQARNWRQEAGGRRREPEARRQDAEEVFLQIGDARSQRAMKIKYGSNSDSCFEKLTIHLLGAG